jgi:hypothetical protein
MSFSLVINSSNVSNKNTNSTFQYNFIGGNFIVEDDMECMLSSAQIPYSIFNITTAYNNNKLVLGFPTGSATNSYTTFTITFPDGFYTLSDIRNYIQQYCITNGLYLINATGSYVYYIDFQLNSSYYANQILLYTVPLSLPVGWTQPSNWIGYSTFTSARTPYIQLGVALNFHDYLGFSNGFFPPGAQNTGYTSNYSLISNQLPPIATYVNSIIVHCSLVNNNIVSPSDILDAFQISNTTFGANINYSPQIEKFVKLTKGSYSSMSLYLTDQNNNPITLIDPNILITLLFKKQKK